MPLDFDIRYALPEDLDSGGDIVYTEEQYKAFGWARANDILTAGENRHYREQFAGADKLADKYRMTSNGEYMIPVTDLYDAVWNGVNRKIVYAKGTIDDPIITRVAVIYLSDTNRILESMEEIYALENNGIQAKTGGVFQVYSASDFRGTYASKRGVREGAGYYNQLRAFRRASGGRPARVTPFVRSQQNAHFPVREEFVDVSGINRAVLEPEKGVYAVYGTRTTKTYSSIEEAIYAENLNIIKSYAKRYGKTPTWVINELRRNADFLVSERESD